MIDQKRKQVFLAVLIAVSFVLIVGMIGLLTLFSAPTLGIHFDYDPLGGKITKIAIHGPGALSFPKSFVGNPVICGVGGDCDLDNRPNS